MRRTQERFPVAHRMQHLQQNCAKDKLSVIDISCNPPNMEFGGFHAERDVSLAKALNGRVQEFKDFTASSTCLTITESPWYESGTGLVGLSGYGVTTVVRKRISSKASGGCATMPSKCCMPRANFC